MVKRNLVIHPKKSYSLMILSLLFYCMVANVCFINGS